jgi:hypothetical protein
VVLVLRQSSGGGTYFPIDPVLSVLAKNGDSLSFFKPGLVDEASLRITSMAQLAATVNQASARVTSTEPH